MPPRSSDQPVGEGSEAASPPAAEPTLVFDEWVAGRRTGMFHVILAGFAHATKGQGPLTAAEWDARFSAFQQAEPA